MNEKNEQIKIDIMNWQNNLEKFLRNNNLFDDSHFHDYYEYFDSEPDDYPVLFVLTSEGSLWNGMSYGNNEIINLFDRYIQKQDYYYETHSSCILVFYLRDSALFKDYSSYFKKKWEIKLIKSEHGLLYNNLYKEIENKTFKMLDFTPREFEFYINKLFIDLGYKTILGPGRNDKGIDLRILSKETNQYILVQIKRYKEKNAIHLDPVKSLCFDVYNNEDENAESGLFITTSRYLPGVETFAVDKKIQLAGIDDIFRWNKDAIKNNNNKFKIMNKYKNELFRNIEFNHPILEIKELILVDTWGYNMTHNDFYLIIYEINKVALVVKIDSDQETDKYGQIGYDYPKLPKDWNGYKPFFARELKNGWFSVKEKFLTPWEGEKLYFNYMD